MHAIVVVDVTRPIRPQDLETRAPIALARWVLLAALVVIALGLIQRHLAARRP